MLKTLKIKISKVNLRLPELPCDQIGSQYNIETKTVNKLKTGKRDQYVNIN